ncbi:MAG TPA: sensor histidine kinase [Solirubrobacteraceae bacterium]|nr:sensor histidine kinase [Solirubrobacteraceae bacterium]
MWRRGKLSTRILASVVAILVATTLVGFGLNAMSRRSDLEHEYQQRALAIAQTFAAAPTVRAALLDPERQAAAIIQPLAQQVRRLTGASYIVVINGDGIRLSHPDPALIGHRVSEPVVALDGRDHLSVDHGNLGVSANAKVPVLAPDGAVAGEVSAGILEAKISDQLAAEIPQLLLFFLCALAIGVLASFWLTRRLKRSTFGLELEEIAALVHEREAMLHNIREGVITTDGTDRVTLINDEARRLLGLGFSPEVIGQTVGELAVPGRLRGLLSGEIAGEDQIVVTDDHMLVVNRVSASTAGRRLGAVITLRDRTELEALIRELDGVEALITALRAQQHEFSNRMHTVAGLIEIGDHLAAARYALDVSHHGHELAETIRSRIERPEIAAMLLAKMTVASERGVRLALSEDSRLPAEGVDVNAALTIIGNLIDNAIDAAGEGDGPGWVEVRIDCETMLTIAVSDSGPGVDATLVPRIFTDGFSTKAATADRARGIGLALVQRLVRQADGTLEVDPTPPTTFTVRIPTAAPADPAASPEARA